MVLFTSTLAHESSPEITIAALLNIHRVWPGMGPAHPTQDREEKHLGSVIGLVGESQEGWMAGETLH